MSDTPPASPKPRRSRSPRMRSKINKEQLLETLKKKKECNAIAQKVVESLIEPVKSPEDLLKELKSINQCHYQDVCEERGILKICGYPLCNENLKDIPTQQYKISVTNKKVYDITERKLFCSAKCFKASNFIKDQLLTSPLWCRDLDEIPEFKLLSLE